MTFLRLLPCLLLGHHWEIRRQFSPLFAELVPGDASGWYECCKRCGKTAAIRKQTQNQKGTPSQ